MPFTAKFDLDPDFAMPTSRKATDAAQTAASANGTLQPASVIDDVSKKPDGVQKIGFSDGIRANNEGAVSERHID